MNREMINTADEVKRHGFFRRALPCGVISAAFAMFFMVVGSLVLSGLLLMIDAFDYRKLYYPAVLLLFVIGGFIAGSVGTRIISDKGIKCGLYCGTNLILILLILYLFFCPFSLTVRSILAFVFILASSCVGGIITVNRI